MTEVCGHNFCHACITFHTAGQDSPEWFCPECRSLQAKFPSDLLRNRLVEKAVKSHRSPHDQQPSKNLCRKHGLELTLCKSPIKPILCSISFSTKIDAAL